MVIRATITNTGEELATYNLNAAGFAEWASSAELDKSIVVLTPGESDDVLITLQVNKGVEGDKLLNLEVLSDNEMIVSQPVSVQIEKGFSFGITGNAIGGGNSWYLWGIGALNVILVIIIIIVALRIVRK